MNDILVINNESVELTGEESEALLYALMNSRIEAVRAAIKELVNIQGKIQTKIDVRNMLDVICQEE